MSRYDDLDFDSYDYDDGPDLPSGICSGCGEECTATVVDEGIGPYEAWGVKGVHHDYCVCSPCCNEEVVEGGSKLLRNIMRTAKKDHLLSDGQGTVKAGERYREIVYRNYRSGGPSWIVAKKHKA